MFQGSKGHQAKDYNYNEKPQQYATDMSCEARNTFRIYTSDSIDEDKISL
jgi:hypothetical protein